jgi:hypothetical protein
LFAWFIVSEITTGFVSFLTFLLLNLNPYLLDYFSVARGYGMAAAFTVASAWFIFKICNDRRKLNVYAALIFAALASLSNFTLLVYFISALILINLGWIGNRSSYTISQLAQNNKPTLIITLLLFIICYEPIRKLVKFNALDFGGNEGFWHDTVGSLINCTLYGQPYSNYGSAFLRCFIPAVFLFMISFACYGFYLKRMKFFSERSAIAILLLVLPITIIISNHFIIKSHFPTDRIGLFLIPLFFIAMIFAIENAFEYLKSKKLKVYIYCLLTLLFGIHTLLSINLTHTHNWKFDADTKIMLSDLEQTIQNENKKKIFLGISWPFESTINFYRTSKNYEWLQKVSRNKYESGEYDFYYLLNENKQFISAHNKKVMKYYPVSDNYLVK